MQVKDDTRPYDSINVTPMLDLAYVLLVVFILMTTATVQGLTVNMPKPSLKPATDPAPLRVVHVTAQGSWLLDGAAVTPAQLETQLRGALAADAKTTVAIRGDARAQYEGVVSVIDLCNKVGISMGLVTARIGT